MRLRTLAVAAVVMLASTSLSAQTTVTGSVVDSLSHRPLAGATVQIVRASTLQAIVVTTDSIGRYRAGGLAPGSYLIGFLHPAIDSLGVTLRPREVFVSGEELRVDLAIPAAKTLSNAVCGLAQRSDSTGLLIGRLHDAASGLPLVGTVAAQWMEVAIEKDGVRTERRVVSVKTSDVGWFAMCGLPSDIDVTVSAVAGTAESGIVELRVPASGVRVRDLRLGRADSTIAVLADSAAPDSARTIVGTLRRGRAKLTGSVRNDKGQPVTKAEVSVPGTGVSTRTGDGGAFSLSGLPAGTQMVEARTFGFAPKRTAVELWNDSVVSVAVSLDRKVQTLDAVRVYGRGNYSLAGLDRRMRSTSGHFVTAADIERLQPVRTTDVLRRIPGVRVVASVPRACTSPRLIKCASQAGSTTGFDDAVLVRGCLPTVYLNGIRMYEDAAKRINTIVDPSQITVIEVYSASGRPVEFWGNACGSVVLWVGQTPR